MILHYLIEIKVSWITMGYIDPGTGSLIIQILIGVLVALGATVKIFWNRIKNFFNKTIKISK